MTDTVIRPQPGFQTDVVRCKADIVVAGGSAGAGKSFLQAYMAGRHHKVKGYNACLMRRTFPMLTGSGSLHDECTGLYTLMGARATQRPLEFTWPSPSRVELRPLQHEHSAQEYRSKQFAYLGWDEASEFEGSQFTFMQSRIRSTCGVKTQFVLTCNPDPDCYLRTWLDWWINDEGFPDKAKAGKTRYFVRVKDEIVWNDAREPLTKYVDSDDQVMSMCFLPGVITDNQILLKKDPAYLAKLKALPAVERDRYLAGNWDIREKGGDFFSKNVFKVWGGTELQRRLMSQDGPGAKIVQSIRVWDFASTPVSGDLVEGIARPADFKPRDRAMHNPDWTCSVLMHRTANGRFIVSDVTFHRDTPGAVQALMERLAIEDGPQVTVGLFADPGQAGEDQAERLRKRVAKHAPVAVLSVKNKEMVARECSRAVWRGEVYYMEKPWNDQFFNQLETFPEPKTKDDAVVALSNCHNWMLEHPSPRFAYEDPEETIRNEIWLPPNVNKVDLLAPKRDNKRRATVVKSGSSLGWRKLW